MVDMKKLIYILIVFIIPLAALAQPVVNGIAWHQASARGAKPSAVAGENGAVNKPVLSAGKFFIYLEHKKGQRILPFRVWINGQPYRVNSKLLAKGPVVRERPGVGDRSDYDTLVKATNLSLVEIQPATPVKSISIPRSQGVADTPDAAQIVVEYYWRAKTYAWIIREIKMLEAVRLQ
jgi:hypothetical protein